MAALQDVRTAVDIWQKRVAASGDRLAYRHVQQGEWRTLTWREADTAAREIAGGLASLGIGRGDAVGLLANTRLEWALSDFGILLAGGVTVPIYASNTPDTCSFIIKD